MRQNNSRTLVLTITKPVIPILLLSSFNFVKKYYITKYFKNKITNLQQKKILNSYKHT